MNKSLVFVLIVLVWSSGSVLDGVARYPIKTDYYLFSQLGGPVLYFLPMFILLSLLVAADFYVLRPAKVGLTVCLAALAAASLHAIVAMFLVVRDIPTARELYVRGREIRGLPIREEGLDLIFSVGSLTGLTFGALAFYGVCALILVRNRHYFEQVKAPPS
jgi:hypothetical protein